MTATICPTVTTIDPDQYKERIERLATFAHRVHIDLADGEFTPVALLPVDQVWWPGGMQVDIHLMYQRPAEHLELLVDLRPQLVVIHAEADVDLRAFAGELHKYGIEFGVAIVQNTPVSAIAPSIDVIDHVLIFSGSLGRHGGEADLSLLGKVPELKKLKPSIEIAWDGGVNDKVAKALADGGVEVLNVGGFIQHAEDPAAAYRQLTELVS